MKGLMALSIALSILLGALPHAQAAAGVPGEGRVLFQYGE